MEQVLHLVRRGVITPAQAEQAFDELAREGVLTPALLTSARARLQQG